MNIQSKFIVVMVLSSLHWQSSFVSRRHQACKKQFPQPLTDPRVAEALHMLNIPYSIIW